MSGQGVLALLRDRGGAAAVETALILPILLALLFGVIEAGRIGWTRNALAFAVQQAARCSAMASVSTACATAAQTQAYAAAQMVGLSQTFASFSVAATANCASLVSASVSYRYIALPVFGPSPTLSAQACAS